MNYEEARALGLDWRAFQAFTVCVTAGVALPFDWADVPKRFISAAPKVVEHVWALLVMDGEIDDTGLQFPEPWATPESWSKTIKPMTKTMFYAGVIAARENMGLVESSDGKFEAYDPLAAYGLLTILGDPVCSADDIWEYGARILADLHLPRVVDAICDAVVFSPERSQEMDPAECPLLHLAANEPDELRRQAYVGACAFAFAAGALAYGDPDGLIPGTDIPKDPIARLRAVSHE